MGHTTQIYPSIVVNKIKFLCHQLVLIVYADVHVIVCKETRQTTETLDLRGNSVWSPTFFGY